MAHKQLLHELLREDQEPFHLKTFISDRRSLLKRPSPAPAPALSPAKIPKSVQIPSKSGKSPLRNFRPPAAGAAALLRVPPGTAELLAEAAARIQKPRKSMWPQSKVRITSSGSGLFGSVLKMLKDRSKGKNRANGEHDFNNSGENEKVKGIKIDKNISDDFGSPETRFSPCPLSPFRFSVPESPSSSGRRTPALGSPEAASPGRGVKQDDENYETGENSNNVNGDDEKEQCSPVSVLDIFFEDETNESTNAIVEEEEEEDEGHDYDPECTYANMERAKQQLLDRLRRFEKLAELDPIELERSFLENSDDELDRETVLSLDEEEEHELLSMSKKQCMDRFLNEAFRLSSHGHNPRKMSTCKNRISSDLIVENKSKIICMVKNEVKWGRICIGLDLFKEVDFDGGQKLHEEIEEITQQVELEIFGQLVEELLEEFV
ncbi:BCL-6 corepressor-like protein 1 [Striga asiatica]|uniref:BCL-6 corepressor-like protein 1 n=1 Tax=Striga asiatica TaxID=4170 RepID=A0A5A7PLT6_STRAF|nr:BCL-6 corepressor-like protein 1 [Striga asiatica]